MAAVVLQSRVRSRSRPGQQRWVAGPYGG